MSESQIHLDLKNEAFKILRNRGIPSKNIEFEKRIMIRKGEWVIVDVFSDYNGKKIIVECGTINRDGKKDFLNKIADEFIHLPYKNGNAVTKGITIKISDEAWVKINSMRNPGETFIEVVDRLLKLKEKKK